MSNKEIFSEGVDVEVSGAGEYRVVDRATGVPIGGIVHFDVEIQNDRYVLGGGWNRKQIVTFDVDTTNVRCTLSFRVEKQ